MHLMLKSALYCATAMFFAFSCLGQEPQTKIVAWEEDKPQANKTDNSAEKALEQKLEEGVKKEKKGKKKRSALDINCDILANDADKQVCVEAQNRELAEKSAKEREKLLKAEPDSMKEIRQEIAKKEKKREKAEKYRSELFARANIQGCEPSSVGVHYRAEEEHKGRVGADIIVRNPTPYSVSISRPRYGVIVENLCPGGSMLLHFSPEWVDGAYVDFPLTASAVSSNGQMFVSSPFTVYMNKYYVQYKVLDEKVWNISLQKISQR